MTDESEGISRRTPSGGAREEEGDEERLVSLFRNRSELKKAFSDLQKSLRLAEERLASQEAATRRAEERFQAIEQLLAQPGTGYTALVYFQLRALWHGCRDRLQAISDELRGRHEERQRREELMRFNQEKQRQLAVIDQQIAQAKDEVEERLSRRNLVRAELEGAQGLFDFARRRKLNELLQQRRIELEASRLHLVELQDRRTGVSTEPWPEFSGLDVGTKREINITVIAAAQELYLDFSTEELARKARDAHVNAIQEMRYGSEEDCKALIGRIRQAVASLGSGRPVPANVAARAELVAKQAQFRSARDTVPVAGTVARIELPIRSPEGEILRRVPLEVNVLADEYWDVYDVLIP